MSIEAYHYAAPALKKQAANASASRTKDVSQKITTDNLQALSGLGPVWESKLNSIGISTYQQIADLTILEISSIELQFPGFTTAYTSNDWKAQAENLIA